MLARLDRDELMPRPNVNASEAATRRLPRCRLGCALDVDVGTANDDVEGARSERVPYDVE